MTAPPRRSILLTALLTVCALLAGTVGAGADEIGDKQAEAEEVAGRLADQAREIVALDKEHRAAQDRLAQTEVALDQAETELMGASLRQEDARRLLVAHAQAAYVNGGSVSFVGNLANGARRPTASPATCTSASSAGRTARRWGACAPPGRTSRSGGPSSTPPAAGPPTRPTSSAATWRSSSTP